MKKLFNKEHALNAKTKDVRVYNYQDLSFLVK